MNREEALTSLAQVVGSWPKGMSARVDEDGTHKFYWAKDLIPSGGYVFGFDDWFEERIRLTQQEWPDEERIDRIGQSGPTGEHYDAVNPGHYRQGGIECIDAMRAMLTDEEMRGYLRGNSFKYRWRYRQKNGVEDLRKAQWYEKKLMDLEVAE